MPLAWTMRSLATLAAIAALDACASARLDHTTSTQRDARNLGLQLRRERDRLTAREIAATPGLATAHDAVAQLRGEFLQPVAHRRASITEPRRLSVFVNGAPSDGIQTLQSLPARAVLEIRFVRANDAQSRFGPAYSGPVILVITRR